MSAWRGHAAALLPDHRRLVERAASPRALWQELYVLAVQRRDDSDLIERVFRVAKKCRASPNAEVRSAVELELYEKLLDDDGARPVFQKHLRESEFLRLEPVLSHRFAPEPFAALRADFHRALAETEAGSAGGTMRMIKDDILEACSEEQRVRVRSMWHRALHLLEVGEPLIAVENFDDDLDDDAVPVAPELRARLRALLARLTGP